MVKSGDNQDYTWTVGDVRKLDTRFNNLEDKVDKTFDLLQDFLQKNEKQALIVAKEDGKTKLIPTLILIGSFLGSIAAAAYQVLNGGA